jgi:hypothetical protein
MATAVARRRTSGVIGGGGGSNTMTQTMSSSPDDVSHLASMLASTQPSPPRPQPSTLMNISNNPSSAGARGFYGARALSPVFAAVNERDSAQMFGTSTTSSGTLNNNAAATATAMENMPRYAPPSFRQSSSGSSSPIFSAQMFHSSHSSTLAINPSAAPMTNNGSNDNGFTAPRPYMTAAIGASRRTTSSSRHANELRRRSRPAAATITTGGTAGEWLNDDGYGSGSDADGELQTVGSASSVSSASGVSPVPPPVGSSGSGNNGPTTTTTGSIFFPGLRPFDDTNKTTFASSSSTTTSGGAPPRHPSSPRFRYSPSTTTRSVLPATSTTTTAVTSVNAAMISGQAHGANGIVNRGYSSSPINGNTLSSTTNGIVQPLRCVTCGAEHVCPAVHPPPVTTTIYFFVPAQ